MRKQRNVIQPKGFTLIELLVGMVVVAIIGSVLMSIFFSVLRGTSKTNSIIKVRQNGNYALSQISRLVREAQSLDVPTTCSSANPQPVSSITITDPENVVKTIACSSGTITIDGESVIDTEGVAVDSDLANCSFSCTIPNGSVSPVVSVGFTVRQQDVATADENTAQARFETSISIRNLE